MDENRTPNADNEYTNSDFGYDAVGNLTTYADKQFRYDWANRLIEVSDNSGIVASYTYDALNRRITKYVVADDTTTSYIYFGSQVLEELENGTFKRRYIYGSYVDEPLSMYDADTNQTYTYLRDRQFSVVGLVDEQGDVVESYRYSSFGLRTVYDANGAEIACSNYNNVYGYTGRRYDAESALWYYRNRMYSPEVGRFLQRDPAGYVDGMNLYAYVRNNPLLFMDPLGLTAEALNTALLLVGGINTDTENDPRHDLFWGNFVTAAETQTQKFYDDRNDDIEKVEWLVEESSYKDRAKFDGLEENHYINIIEEKASDIGAEVSFYQNDTGLVELINNGDNGEPRDAGSISDTYIFGHGSVYDDESGLILRYPIEENNYLSNTELGSLNTNVFKEGSTCYNYSCNGGTTIIDTGGSFINSWTNATGQDSLGSIGRVDYAPTAGIGKKNEIIYTAVGLFGGTAGRLIQKPIPDKFPILGTKKKDGAKSEWIWSRK